jgi:hypothetical protein
VVEHVAVSTLVLHSQVKANIAPISAPFLSLFYTFSTPFPPPFFFFLVPQDDPIVSYEHIDWDRVLLNKHIITLTTRRYSITP